MTFNGDHTILGSIRSNRTECFKAANLSVSLTDETIEFDASSHGTIADRAWVRFKGDFSDEVITGRLTVSASTDDPGTETGESSSPSIEELCGVTNLPFSLKRTK